MGANALNNLNALLAGLNDPHQATPNGVDFQDATAFMAFASTQLDPNQDYNFDVSGGGTLSMSVHNDAEDEVASNSEVEGDGSGNGHSGFDGIITNGPGNLYHIAGRLPPFNGNEQYRGTCVWCVGAECIDHYDGLDLNGTDLLSDYLTRHTSTDREFDKMFDSFCAHGTNSDVAFPDYLCFSPTNNIVGSLLAGYPVAAEFEQYTGPGNPSGLHEVFITGFSVFFGTQSAGFYYTYYNSQNCQYESLPPNAFHWACQVTGAK